MNSSNNKFNFLLMQNKKVYWLILIFFLTIIIFIAWKANVLGLNGNRKDFNQGVKGIEIQKKIISKETNKIDQNLFLPIANLPISPVPYKKENTSNLKLPNAHAAAIIDVDSGKIIFEKNGHQKRQIASLTKILTAIIAMEKFPHPEKEIVTIGDEIYIEGTKVGCPRSGYCISNRLKKGEKLYLIDLIKAMLMNSANDAATAVGKHIGGSIDGFAKIMNQKVQEMGLTDSHFLTPSGLEIDGREKEGYSSAIDLAKIAAYSMQYKTIWKIFRIPGTKIFSTNKKYSHKIINTDRLLNQMPGCLGGKTGFTPNAGHCLMMGVESPVGQHKIIIVLLDDPYRWQDIQKAAQWVWDNYEWK